MSYWSMYYWMGIVTLSLVCLGLLILIVKLVRQQRQNHATNQARLADLHEQLSQYQAHRQNSVKIIAKAVLAKQCDYTEGCIRLNMLVQALDHTLLDHPDYNVLKVMTTLTEHMPIKKQWQQLDKKIKAKYTKQRLQLETQHQQAIEKAATLLLTHEF